MRKTGIITVVTILVTMLSSCYKEYNCTCTYALTYRTGFDTTVILPLGKTIKPKAKDSCNYLQAIYKGTAGYSGVNCGI